MTTKPGSVSMQSFSIDKRFLFLSSNEANFTWLSQALSEWVVEQQAPMPPDMQLSRIENINPRLVLMDFSGDEAGNCDLPGMIALAQSIKNEFPERLLIAVGTTSNLEATVSAFRAGIHHFIDMAAAEEEARDVIHKLITTRSVDKKQPSGKIFALLGARPGVGCTTLSVHLADMLQRREADRLRVCLLDMGLPISDGQLYLNVNGTFSFADLARNLHRLDPTLIQTAVAQSQSGIKVISLPRELLGMQHITLANVDALLTHLRAYFDTVIIDLGGFDDMELVTNIANASDQTWLISDQSLGSLVSLAALLKQLDQHHLTAKNIGLVVNRFDVRYGLNATQIADRFKLTLMSVIPDCTLRLINSANSGKLVHEVNKQDPYAQAVRELSKQIRDIANPAQKNKEKSGGWMQRVRSGINNIMQKKENR